VSKDVLVTGAAGFIGSRICELLLAEGRQVVGLDNLNDAYDVRLKQWRLERLQQCRGFSFYQKDIVDVEAMRAFFAGRLAPFEAVINLAARAGVRQSVANPRLFMDTNIIGTLNLLDGCKAAGTKKFVLASTSSLYGDSVERPYREDAPTDRLLSPYAVSKKSAEVLCYTYHKLAALDVSVLRFFTVYGPAGRPDMSLFRFVQWVSEGRPVMIFGDGKQQRDFTYVDDIARGAIAALRPLGYEIINLGSDRPTVLMDALHAVERLTGCTANIEYRESYAADVPATWADIGKAKRLLGWEPRTMIDEGLTRLVEWYGQERAWAMNVETMQLG
jgi:nucleoside-diphosphate-sugar epimerase